MHGTDLTFVVACLVIPSALLAVQTQWHSSTFISYVAKSWSNLKVFLLGQKYSRPMWVVMHNRRLVAHHGNRWQSVIWHVRSYIDGSSLALSESCVFPHLSFLEMLKKLSISFVFSNRFTGRFLLAQLRDLSQVPASFEIFGFRAFFESLLFLKHCSTYFVPGE